MDTRKSVCEELKGLVEHVEMIAGHARHYCLIEVPIPIFTAEKLCERARTLLQMQQEPPGMEWRLVEKGGDTEHCEKCTTAYEYCSEMGSSKCKRKDI